MNPRAYFSQFIQRVRQRLRADVYYVADEANWSFEWVAHYITAGVSQLIPGRFHRTRNPWSLRHQIIHFGNRYLFFHGNFAQLHPSNHIIVTWFHGNPDDPDRGIQQLFEKLPAVIPYVHQWVTSCQISVDVLKDAGILPEKIALIPIGVDLERFKPPANPSVQIQIREQLGIPLDALCIGSFQKDGHGQGDGNEPKLIKGPDTFLEVIEQLHQRYSDKLVILLTGSARGYVKNGLEKMGVRYVHRFLQDYHDIVPFYYALDGYLITSRTEGGPQGLCESWATGVPVVSTRMGMPADLVRHGRNGLLAEVEDSAELAKQMTRLIEDRALREQIIRQALIDVQEYSWNKIAGMYYQQLYRPILEKKR